MHTDYGNGLLFVTSNKCNILTNSMISLIDGMTLVQDWSQGKAAICQNLGCSTVTGGLSECQYNCMDNFECNLINFCPSGADCTIVNRCCLRKCSGDDYELTNRWKGWDIYVTGMAYFEFR